MCHPVRGSTVTTMLKGMLSRSPSQPTPYSFYNFKAPNGVCGPAPIFTVLGDPASIPPRSRFAPRPNFYSTWCSRLDPASDPASIPPHFLQYLAVPPRSRFVQIFRETPRVRNSCSNECPARTYSTHVCEQVAKTNLNLQLMPV